MPFNPPSNVDFSQQALDSISKYNKAVNPDDRPYVETIPLPTNYESSNFEYKYDGDVVYSQGKNFKVINSDSKKYVEDNKKRHERAMQVGRAGVELGDVEVIALLKGAAVMLNKYKETGEPLRSDAQEVTALCNLIYRYLGYKTPDACAELGRYLHHFVALPSCISNMPSGSLDQNMSIFKLGLLLISQNYHVKVTPNPKDIDRKFDAVFDGQGGDLSKPASGDGSITGSGEMALRPRGVVSEAEQ